MEVRGADEISAISQAFNLFADKISSMLLTVRSSSSVVAGNTVNLADNNNELSARVTAAGRRAGAECFRDGRTETQRCVRTVRIPIRPMNWRKPLHKQRAAAEI